MSLNIDFHSHTIKIKTMLVSRTSTCFLDKNLAKSQNYPIMTKKYPMAIEIFDGKLLILGDFIHIINFLEIMLEWHGFIVFNVISFVSNNLVFYNCWLEMIHLDIDWKKRKLIYQTIHFHIPNRNH